MEFNIIKHNNYLLQVLVQNYLQHFGKNGYALLWIYTQLFNSDVYKQLPGIYKLTVVFTDKYPHLPFGNKKIIYHTLLESNGLIFDITFQSKLQADFINILSNYQGLDYNELINHNKIFTKLDMNQCDFINYKNEDDYNLNYYIMTFNIDPIFLLSLINI